MRSAIGPRIRSKSTLAAALIIAIALPLSGTALLVSAGRLELPSLGPNELVGAGDIAQCGSKADAQTAALLDQFPNAAVFTAGDDAYETGSPVEFAKCYDPTWGRDKSRTHPVPGNHEYETTGAAGYFGYFGPSAGEPGKGYYSFDLGPLFGSWHIIVLNSNCSDIGQCSAGSAQEQWLRTDLATHQSQCVLAIWHHPRFSSGDHGNDTRTAVFWEDLYAAGADVIINGHDHDYERFAPQNPSGIADPARGIREFVVGTGGAELGGFHSDAPNTEVRNDETFGVLKLTLHAASYDWQFIPVPGSTFTDQGTGTCH